MQLTDLHNIQQLSCTYAGICSGCPRILEPYAQQIHDKGSVMTGLLMEAGFEQSGPVPVISLGQGGLRDRADLTIFQQEGQQRLGLYDLNRQEIVDLAQCPQMSPGLASWYADFRRICPQVQFGHLRLRVAPDGTRGVWLDFPNHIIAYLLEEETSLRRLADVALVELSQRRNRLHLSTELSLGEPVLFPWWETPGINGPVPLYATIGSFTQPGLKANHHLIKMVLEYLSQSQGLHWLELGSGIGAFTLPMAANGYHITALENDPRAIAGLTRSSSEAGLSERIQVQTANIHQPNPSFQGLITQADGILADPPRSGLRRFPDNLAQIPKAKRPRWFVYVSCFAESMLTDMRQIRTLGYQLQHIQGLDQFPQSRHTEWVALLERS